MRILVVAPFPPRRCGIGAYARTQVDALRREGHQVTVLSPPDGDGDVRAGFPGGRAFLRAGRLARRFDRVVVHFQPALYYRPRRPLSKVLTSLALVALVVWRRQVELLVHEADPPRRGRPDYVLLALAFRSARRVAFHTEAEWRALEHDYGVRVRAALVPHLAKPSARPTREEARRRLGLAGEPSPVFVCAGFLQPSKGFDRAVAALAGADGSARLYVVGSIRDRTVENEAHLRELRESCAAMPGAVLIESYPPDDEFDAWLAAADWVILPYRRSWSSGVLTRARALGTPAIVAAVGGLPEQAGEDDVVFEDDEGLARAMKEIAAGQRPDPGPRPDGGPSSRAVAAPHREHESEWDPFYEPPRPEGERRRGRTMLLGLILVSVLLAALAQLTLKHGMNQVSRHGAAPLSLGSPGDTARRIVSNVSVWAGLATFAASAAIWLVVLSRASLSFAYPFASLTYVMILLFDRFVLNDEVPVVRWGGVALIIAGILMVSRTPHN